MRKIILFLFLSLFSGVACADVKISALPQDNSPTTDDITITVDAPNTSSPVTKKVTLAALRTLMLAGDGSNLTGLTISQTTGNVPDTRVSFTDITTGNASTSAHGFAPKYPSDATKYLDGTGAYSVPSTSAAGGFTDDGTIVHTTTNTDNVGIGTSTTPAKLTVAGAVTATGAVTGSNLSGTNTGDQTITLTGAVTGTGTGSFVTSIPNASITEAKLATTLSAAIGGTGLSTSTDDAVLLGNGTLWQAKVISDCQDTAGQHLNYNASSNTWSCGTSGSSTASGWTSDSSTKAYTTYNVGIGTTAPRGALDIPSGSAYLPTVQAGTWNGSTIGSAYGGTGLTSASDDNVIVGSGSGWQSKALTDCNGAGKAVTYTASSNAFGCNTISAASVAWGSVTGDVTAQNWQSTQVFLPRGAVNWVDVQKLTTGVNWGANDQYAKSWNSYGSGVGALQMFDSAGANWVKFQAPSTIAASKTWTMPNADGTNGQVLTTNGSGTLSFATATGSGTVSSGLSGYFSYYPSTGTTVDDSTLWHTDGTSVGIGAFSTGNVFQIIASDASSAWISTGASGSSGGVFFSLDSDDGSAMASGDHLGGFFFGGQEGGASVQDSAAIRGYADGAWSPGVNPSRLEFQTSLTDTRTTQMILDNNGVRRSPMPSAQTITAGTIIAADSCGGLKQITSSGSVTTSTTNTFTAPATANNGCCMDVVNTGSNNITLDNNANFKSAGAADVVMTGTDSVRVCSNGSAWYQISALLAN